MPAIRVKIKVTVRVIVRFRVRFWVRVRVRVRVKSKVRVGARTLKSGSGVRVSEIQGPGRVRGQSQVQVPGGLQWSALRWFPSI